MPFSVWRFSSSLKAIVANAGRLSEPSSDRIRSPNASTSLASPSVPGSTTSREITSPSTTTPPSSLNVEDTVDFPAPIPPDRPMRNTAPVCQDTAEPNTPADAAQKRTPRLIGVGAFVRVKPLGAACELLPQSGKLRVAGQ